MEEEKFSFTDGCFFRKAPIESPIDVIQEFYEIYDLEHVKIMLWKLFKAAMGTENSVFMNRDEEIDDVIFFLETFLMLNMAVYELNQRTIKQ